MFLRQSTSVTLRIGPFLDPSDGVTEETALSVLAADIQISKAGGAFANKNDTTDPTHDSDGWYSCVLNTTDTATVGQLIVKSHNNTTHVPVWHYFYVLNTAIYDALFASAAAGFNASQQVVAASVAGNVVGTIGDLSTNAKSSVLLEAQTALVLANLDHVAGTAAPGDPPAGTYLDRMISDGVAPYDRTTDSLQAIRDRGDAAWDTATSVSIAAGGITAASFANNAIAAGAIASNAIDADALSADAIAEIQSGLSTLTTSQVNAEVIDAISVDTYGEPASVPNASSSLATKIGWLFALARNKITQTATTETLRNDADGANIGTAAHTDDGTTLTRGKWS